MPSIRTMPRSFFDRALRSFPFAVALGVLPSRAAHADDWKSGHFLEPSDEVLHSNNAEVPLDHATAYVWTSGTAHVDPPKVDPGADRSLPGFDIALGAGGWGERAAEPMAIAYIRYAYTAQSGVNWLYAPHDDRPYVSCEPGQELCVSSTVINYNRIHQRAYAFIRRMYRLKQINPAPLPADITSVPLKVDYTVGIHVSSSIPNPGPLGREAAARGDAVVALSWPVSGTFSSQSAGISCSSGNLSDIYGLTCNTAGLPTRPIEPPPSGPSHRGTFDAAIPLAAIDTIQLVLKADIFAFTPACTDQPLKDGTACVVPVYSTTGHAVADPFVYIDPAWPQASWFKVEMATDETDTTWTEPQRSPPFDTATLKPMDGGGVDGGTGGTDSPPSNGSTVEPDGGIGPGSAAPTSDDDDGCTVGGNGKLLQAGVPLLLTLFSLALLRRRRHA